MHGKMILLNHCSVWCNLFSKKYLRKNVMKLNLNLLKNHLHRFAYECNLTIKEIGELVDNSSSVSDFQNKLDELCEKYVSKTSSEVLAEFGIRFANGNTSPKPTPTENSPLQIELVEVGGKIDKLNDSDKTPKA